MDLNNSGSPQFHTATSNLYHKCMVRLPLMMTKSTNTLLIVGGGDGLGVKEALEFPAIKKIIQVELDPILVALVKAHPIMKKISNNSLNHPKVTLKIEDGIKFLLNSSETYDVIIDDCDFDVTNQTASHDMYRLYLQCLITKLTPGGIACIMEPLGGLTSSLENNMCHMPENQEERFLWMQNMLEKQGHIKDWKLLAPYVACKLVDSPIGPECFIYCSNQPITIKRSY